MQQELERNIQTRLTRHTVTQQGKKKINRNLSGLCSKYQMMRNPVDIKIHKSQAHTLIEIRFRIKTLPTKPSRNLFLKT